MGQPLPHKEGCTCSICDYAPRVCPYCKETRKGPRALGTHIWYSHKMRTRKRKPSLVPDGEGFIKRALIDSTVNLGALSRFGMTVQNATMTRVGGVRFSKRLLQDRIRMYDESPDTWHLTSYVRTPGRILSICGRLAVLAGVPMRVVYAALLTYGIEHLAQELRGTRVAPTPHLPQDFGVNLRKRYNEAKRGAKTQIPEVIDDGSRGTDSGDDDNIIAAAREFISQQHPGVGKPRSDTAIFPGGED